MDHALDLAAFRVLAQGVFVVGAAQLDDTAGGILDRFVGANHVATAQARFAAGNQAFEAVRRGFFEVAGVDVDLTGERQHAGANVLLGMARQLQVLDLAFRVIGDHHLERLEHAHGARRVGVQVFADGEFQHADVHQTAGAVDADHVAEGADRSRRVATASVTGERRHARVIPAADVFLVDQLLELALAGDGVVQVQAGELVLTRLRRHGQVGQEPFVQRAMVLELQGADGVGHAFDGIRLTVGKVIARVDAPLVTGLMVMGVADAIEDRVTQVHVARGHVDLGAQRAGAIRELTCLHARE